MLTPAERADKVRKILCVHDHAPKDDCRSDLLPPGSVILTAEDLVSTYRQYPLAVAYLCDEVLDRRGGLLGRVRDAALLAGKKPS